MKNLGNRKNTKEDEEFRDAANKDESSKLL